MQGTDFYMVKPFEPDELIAQIESSLREAVITFSKYQRDRS